MDYHRKIFLKNEFDLAVYVSYFNASKIKNFIYFILIKFYSIRILFFFNWIENYD